MSWYEEYVAKQRFDWKKAHKNMCKLAMQPIQKVKSKHVDHSFLKPPKTKQRFCRMIDTVVWDDFGKVACENMHARHQRVRLREKQAWQRLYAKAKKQHQKMLKPFDMSPIITNFVWMRDDPIYASDDFVDTETLTRKTKLPLQKQCDGTKKRWKSYFLYQNDGACEKYQECEAMKIVKIRRLLKYQKNRKYACQNNYS